MTPKYRDGLLAGIGVAVLGTLVATVAGPGLVLDLRAVVAGVIGALLLEVVFLRYPGPLLALWERRGIPVVSLAAVVALGVIGIQYWPWIVGALLWGLVTYLVLLGCVLVGFGNPLSVVSKFDSEGNAGDRE